MEPDAASLLHNWREFKLFVLSEETGIHGYRSLVLKGLVVIAVAELRIFAEPSLIFFKRKEFIIWQTMDLGQKSASAPREEWAVSSNLFYLSH